MPEFKTDKALVLSARRLGENTYTLSLFTRSHGRHLGVYKKKLPPVTGSFVEGRWQARLPEQMGHFYVEPTHNLSAGFLDDKKRLACIASVCALLDSTLPERQNYSDFFDHTITFLNTLTNESFLTDYVRWESDLLATLGYGLDCSKCAGGGDDNDLAYISPKTGRAVSRQMGAPYHDKLLTLPKFLWQDSDASTQEIKQGLALTQYFFENYAPIKSLPKVRELLYR